MSIAPFAELVEVKARTQLSGLSGADMKSTVENCRIVVRRLKPGPDVAESSTDVESIEQLFEHCLGLAEQHLLERLVISGRDGRGRKRALAFSFQSVSERD